MESHWRKEYKGTKKTHEKKTAVFLVVSDRDRNGAGERNTSMSWSRKKEDTEGNVRRQETNKAPSERRAKKEKKT